MLSRRTQEVFPKTLVFHDEAEKLTHGVLVNAVQSSDPHVTLGVGLDAIESNVSLWNHDDIVRYLKIWRYSRRFGPNKDLDFSVGFTD